MRIPDSKAMQVTLVLLQFSTAAVIVLSTQWSRMNVWSVLAIALGATLGIWAWVTMGLTRLSVMPQLRSEATLVTSGPYRFFRHPMYLAVVIFCSGFVWMPFAWRKVMLWLLLIAVVTAKARIEERFLSERFSDYESYRRRAL